MSDCFNHGADAYDSLHEHGFQHSWGGTSGPRLKSAPFNADPLYFHTRWKYISIVAETPKAYLLERDSGTSWVPKALCRQHCKADKTIYIWDNYRPVYIHQSNVFTEEAEDEV